MAGEMETEGEEEDEEEEEEDDDDDKDEEEDDDKDEEATTVPLASIASLGDAIQLSFSPELDAGRSPASSVDSSLQSLALRSSLPSVHGLSSSRPLSALGNPHSLSRIGARSRPVSSLADSLGAEGTEPTLGRGCQRCLPREPRGCRHKNGGRPGRREGGGCDGSRGGATRETSCRRRQSSRMQGAPRPRPAPAHHHLKQQEAVTEVHAAEAEAVVQEQVREEEKEEEKPSPRWMPPNVWSSTDTEEDEGKGRAWIAGAAGWRLCESPRLTSRDVTSDTAPTPPSPSPPATPPAAAPATSPSATKASAPRAAAPAVGRPAPRSPAARSGAPRAARHDQHECRDGGRRGRR